ncbi:hypothetical protein ACJMK2_035551 [Sinanodonta woodiana]|uniref:Uncharacterized protein n=1 Tax=Sinanodonta woodiana TaxID=1069815 RepID=A0ABD3WVB3_SINWO
MLYSCKEKSAKDLGRKIIGKFTAGGRYDNAKYSSRLITDNVEYDFIVKNLTENNKFVGRRGVFLSNGKRLGTIVTYIDGENAQWTHLRSSMLAYTTINLLSMINRFPETAVRVATDSMYIHKKYIEDVKPYLKMQSIFNDSENWGTWRIKREMLHDYCLSADAEILNDYVEYSSEFSPSSLPPVSDPVTRYKIVYLSGCGGSGKTTRAIELYKNSNVIVLTPTHRLARELTQRGVKAYTYHSFFRYKGDLWTPERMGDKFIPEIVIWDEICTVSEETLKLFLDWLSKKNTKIILCGDPGQPPPFSGNSPHEWLKSYVDYHEEVTTDYRSLDEQLRELKSKIRLQSNKTQCEILRTSIAETPLDEFWKSWNPSDVIIASRKIVRDELQNKLFKLHEKKFPTMKVPLCYRPSDTRRQNILVDIPGESQQQILVLNDIVLVDIKYVKDAIHDGSHGAVKSHWMLGYAATIHS